MTFQATHRHASGKLYQLVAIGKARVHTETWENAVIYRDADDNYFATDLRRWNARFEPVEAL